LEQQYTNYYHFHGLRLAVATHDPCLRAALHARLRLCVAPPDNPAQLHFNFHRVATLAEAGLPQPRGRIRLIYEPPRIGGEMLYAEEEDRLYLRWGEYISGICNPRQNHTQIFYESSAHDRLWLISHATFMSALIELLKRRGYYSLHAAGLCLNGRGLLLPGASGSGKTTLAIALARAGFGFLGDDMMFLRPASEGLQIRAFPDEIDVTAKTVQLFPELAELLEPSPGSGRVKRQLRPEAVTKDLVAACRPGVLVFPQVATAAASTLKPMGRDEALLELASNVLLTESRASQAHLDALAELVRQSDCYRLETGQNLEALAVQLAHLVS
jgi:hypothetical protein